MAGARFVVANGLRFAYLQEGPQDGPLALCLHGFPDHARTWRHLLPELAAAGYRAVAPWLRGYAPTQVPDDGVYDLDTLALDVNCLHAVLGGDQRAVLIGHDWGALSAYRAAAAAPGRWRRVVGLAVPPEPALVGAPRDLNQLRRSWYTVLFQLPGATRAVEAGDFALIDHLWSSWSPGYEREPDDIGPLQATLRSPGTIRAALGYYRAQRTDLLLGRFPHRSGHVPPHPTLYLHGEDDGCIGVRYADRARAVVGGTGSRVEVIDDAGHFLHLEAPEAVIGLVRSFVGPAR